MNFDFWKGKRVFLTGHTGFKGGWTILWLQKLGAITKGYALPPNTNPSLFDLTNIKDISDSQFDDICDKETLEKSILDFMPEIVFHMAAQPLVRASYDDPVNTYQTNVMGTVNLFEAIRNCDSIKAVVNITTDKCYQNNEWEWGYRENDPMGGYDPYSNSKGCSELVTSSYRQSFFNNNSKVSIASARAGNVIGGGDWSQDRLIPDAIKAFNLDQSVVIRNPLATRPWQHVLEPISGYLELAEKLYLSDGYDEGWNFGPYEEDCIKVGDVMDYLVNKWPHSVSWKTDKTSQPHEAQLLKLDISKARSKLNWKPRWKLEKALDAVIDWHLSHLNNKDMKKVTLEQITEYEKQFGNRYEQN